LRGLHGRGQGQIHAGRGREGEHTVNHCNTATSQQCNAVNASPCSCAQTGALQARCSGCEPCNALATLYLHPLTLANTHCCKRLCTHTPRARCNVAVLQCSSLATLMVCPIPFSEDCHVPRTSTLHVVLCSIPSRPRDTDEPVPAISA
jgi:hypothetical protein